MGVLTTEPVEPGALFGPIPPNMTLTDPVLMIGHMTADTRPEVHQVKLNLNRANKGSALAEWLPYVRAARDNDEQNLEALLVDGHLFYRCTRHVTSQSELFVWYTQDLARTVGVPEIHPAFIQGDNLFVCPYCCKEFIYPFSLRTHIRFKCERNPYLPTNKTVSDSKISLLLNPTTIIPEAVGVVAGTKGEFLTNNVSPANSFKSLSPEYPRGEKRLLDYQNTCPSANENNCNIDAKRLEVEDLSPTSQSSRSSSSPRHVYQRRSSTESMSSPPLTYRHSASPLQRGSSPVHGGMYGGSHDDHTEDISSVDRSGSSDDEITHSAFKKVQKLMTLSPDYKFTSSENNNSSITSSSNKDSTRGNDSNSRLMPQLNGSIYPSLLHSPAHSSAAMTRPHHHHHPSITHPGPRLSSASMHPSRSILSPSVGAMRPSAIASHMDPLSRMMLPHMLAAENAAAVAAAAAVGVGPGPSHHTHPHPINIKENIPITSAATANMANMTRQPLKNTADLRNLLNTGKLPFHPDWRFHFPFYRSQNPIVETLLHSASNGYNGPFPSQLNLAQNWCAKCNATFRMTSDLVYHMRSHHKLEKSEVEVSKKKVLEKLKCEVCGEAFRERHHLTRHMTSHQEV